jgi:hypothetical protein
MMDWPVDNLINGLIREEKLLIFRLIDRQIDELIPG